MNASTRISLALLALGFLSIVAGHATAKDPAPPTWTLPTVRGITIDGNANEKGWSASGLRISMPTVTSSARPDTDGVPTVEPEVRLATQDGELLVSAIVSEPPGTGMGALLMVASDDAKTAAEATSIVFRPFDIRHPTYTVRSARAIGRGAVRVRGATDLSMRDRWSLELSVPLEDLARSTVPKKASGEESNKDKGSAIPSTLRVAITISLATPNVASTAPDRARWRGPAAWAIVEAPASGWQAVSAVKGEALLEQDAKEDGWRAPWNAYQLGGTEGPPRASHRQAMLDALEERVARPLDRVTEFRPALLPVTESLRGDFLEKVGEFERAKKAYDKALAVAPGWRMARFGRDVRLLARSLIEGRVGGPTSYTLAFERIAETRKRASDDPWVQSGCDLAEGILRSRLGDMKRAEELLSPQLAWFGHDELVVRNARIATEKRTRERLMSERGRQHMDADKEFSRVQINTSRGKIVVELYEREAPNTVKHFLWLVGAQFYDGTKVHHTVPFFYAHLGDPLTRDAKDASAIEDNPRIGTGRANYTIPDENSRRLPLRGTLMLTRDGPGTGSSRFFVLTGAAFHLSQQMTAFGRVVEGMDVVDRLERGDTIESVVVLRPSKALTGPPKTTSGSPAPNPK